MISRPDSLYRALSINKTDIDKVLADIDSYYYEYEKRTVKKNGKIKTRVINPSKGTLKIIQKRIDNLLKEKIPATPYAFGSTKGRSGISNAKFHQGNKYIFQTDLKGFFPSITQDMVYQMFVRFGFSKDVSSILTKLTTHKGHIPQGASTSSTVANLVFTKTGNVIAEYCKKNGVKFTTYVDDLTISSPTDFKDKTPYILNFLKQDGYVISHAKTTYKTSPPKVTGPLVRNNSLDITPEFRTKMNNPQGKSDIQIKGEQNYANAVFQTNSPVKR
jgi:RNA-directed DNA polymerase